MAKHTINIYRTRTFFNESQDGIDEYLAATKQSIGSNWSSSSNKQIGTGLTPTEISILIPHLIDLEPTDRDFKKAVKDFYQSIHTNVDYTSGVELDISLHNNDEPLSVDNLPNNVYDYVKYRHAMQHPEVAPNAETAKGNSLYRFYIHNPLEVKRKTTDIRERRDEALAEYLKLTKEKGEEKIDNVMFLFGEDARLYDKDAKLEFLSAKANSSDSEVLSIFIKNATDKDLDLKGVLAKAVKVGVLKMAGARYLYVENGNVLAYSQDEAVLNLKEDADTLTALKALIQDKTKTKAKGK